MKFGAVIRLAPIEKLISHEVVKMPFYAMNPMIKHSIHALLLTWNELKRNALAWLAPLPVLLGTIWWSSSRGWEPIKLNTTGTWLYLLCCLILIMVYGLQSFSSEADRKTLDFIITKPISPYAIISAKYLPGLLIFWCWWYAFNFFLQPNLALLALPKGMGIEWIILVLILVHATSFLSGILAKGLERFFVITVMTLIMGSGAYYLWHKIFTLINANFLWFDIPPQLLFFLEKLFPYYLAALGLAIPLIGVIWHLRSKIRLWRFKPAIRLLGVWLLTLFIIELADFLLGPPVWPDPNAKSGDWLNESGIVLAGNFEAPSPQSYLSFNRLGQRSRIIYTGTGTDLKNPRFSPGGNRIVFSENGRLKILNLTNRTSNDIGEGEVAVWSDDGMRLIAGKKIGPKGLSLLYLIDLKNNKTHQLTPEQLAITDLVWDSERERLYILGFAGELKLMDLKDNSVKELPFPKNDQPRHFGVAKPSVRFQKEDRLIFIGQVFAQTIKVYLLNLENETIQLSEEKSDFRILTNGPLLFNQEGTAYLWPRIDGGFVYQATYYERGHHEHEHGHDHEHDSEKP